MVLYKAQQNLEIARTGPYSRIRHPQYAAFILIMVVLLQWPTLPTLLMFPVLIGLYISLAGREEKEALTEFGEAYIRYAAATPRFIPRLQNAGSSGINDNPNQL